MMLGYVQEDVLTILEGNITRSGRHRTRALNKQPLYYPW